MPTFINSRPWAKIAVQSWMPSGLTTREFPYAKTPLCVWCATGGWKSTSSYPFWTSTRINCLDYQGHDIAGCIQGKQSWWGISHCQICWKLEYGCYNNQHLCWLCSLHIVWPAQVRCSLLYDWIMWYYFIFKFLICVWARMAGYKVKLKFFTYPKKKLYDSFLHFLLLRFFIWAFPLRFLIKYYYLWKILSCMYLYVDL